LSVDAAEAHELCWRCGCKKRLERCHIVADSLGGKDEPANLVLLCRRCHISSPNVTDPEIMWDWIKSYRVPFYDTFWGILAIREYEFIYQKSLRKEFEDLKLEQCEGVSEAIAEIAREVAKETDYHFGSPQMSPATMAGIYRMLLKRLAARYGKTLPPRTDTRKIQPWFL